MTGTSRRFMLAVVAGALAGVLAGCEGEPPVRSQSVEVITVDAGFERQVQTALLDVHRDLGAWIVKDDGTRSDPTYRAGSRRWKRGRGEEDAKEVCSRGYIEFEIEGGKPVRIETVYVADETVLVLLESEDEETAQLLHDAVLEGIRRRCTDK